MGIFRDYAPKYWEAGLPCIPLQTKSKSPVTQGWTRYGVEMLPDEVKAEWLAQYPEGNIGLPLGPMSGLVAIDIDTDDPEVVNMLAQILPETPWKRRGKKGAVWIYRWNEHKTARIRDAEGKSLLELLSTGTQVVLPPSIHPDTQMPYTANCDLWDVLASVPRLPREAEKLIRQGLNERGMTLSTKGYSKVTEYISVGNRDSKMISMAGLLAKSVVRGERSLVNAVGEMRVWVENFVEKVIGDQLDAEKGVQRILSFIKRDVSEGKKALPAGWDDGLSTEEGDKMRAELGQLVEEWTTQRCLDFLEEQFTAFSDRQKDGEQRREAIEKVLMHMSVSPKITPMDHDTIFSFISQAMGQIVSKTALRKRFAQLTQGPATGMSHSEIADLVLKDMEQYGPIRHASSKFWQWVGSHWEELTTAHIMAKIITDHGDLPAARRASDHKGILMTMQALRASDLADSSVKGLNFANGFLTSDLRLLDHEPKYGMTYVLPFPFDPTRAGAAHRFNAFLNQSWGDDPDYVEKVQALREAIAATLFGMASQYQKAFCVYGVPHSGKSVLLEIIRGTLPPEATCNVPPDKWDDTFLPTRMVGKLVNFCGELSESSVIPGDRFKYIIDGGDISGQLKGMQIFDFKPTCAHWFASNHLARTRDSSAGFSRRWQFFHFNKPVAQSERVVGLANDIAAEERDAIVAWAVMAMPELERQQNFTMPSSHIALVEEMAGMNNSVRFFFKGGPVRYPQPPAQSAASAPVIETSESLLHSAYWTFCKLQVGAKPVSLRIFRQRAMELERECGFQILPGHSADEAVYLGCTLVGGH
jgi:phage/plasmid-associated DNA primase